MKTQSTVRMMLGPAEISQIAAAAYSVQPKRVLEWGSGGSTKFFLDRFASIERLVSIEHHAEWHKRVAAAVRDPRLDLRLVRASEEEPRPSWFGINKSRRHRWRMRAESDGAIFADYVAFPQSLGIDFDLVFIDGRARCHCIAAGWKLLRAGGLMIIHDAQRAYLSSAIARLGNPFYLATWSRGQVCLIYKPVAD